MLTLFLLVLTAVYPVQAAAMRVVTPTFEKHDELAWVYPPFIDFSTEQTILGTHSVKMHIPEGAVPGWGFGLNAEVMMAGISTGLGLSRYAGISFKANFHGNPLGAPPVGEPYPVQPAVSAPLYVTLILYDRTNDVWVSMIPTTLDAWGGARMIFSGPDENGWRTATPVGGSTALWIAWTFGGTLWPGLSPYPGEVMTLSDWGAYIAANNLNVKVQKVNIQFGYMHPDYGTTWGTVYVDQLKTHGFILDFEPAA
jgi:hypothetical protein